MDSQPLLEGERKQIIETVKEGAKSAHWKIVKGQIHEWILEENGILDAYKRIGVRNDSDRKNYNESVYRLGYLKRLVRVNESIITHNMSILERTKANLKDAYKSGESFVNELIRTK